jgi:hypothetical protein
VRRDHAAKPQVQVHARLASAHWAEEHDLIATAPATAAQQEEGRDQ